MAVNVKKGFAVGIDSLWYGARDSAGYLIGNTATPPVAGATSLVPLARLEGIKTFPLGLQEAERVNVTGDNGAIGQRLFSPIELPNGSPTFSVIDLSFAALAMGLSVHDVSGGSFLGLQPDEISFQDMILMTVTAATSQASGTVGATYYTGKLLLSVQCFYQDDAGLTERAPTDFTFSMTAQKAEAYPWGVAFSTASNGSTKFAAMRYAWPHLPMIVRGTGDATEVTFTFPYDVAEDAATNFVATVNGTPQTWATGAPSAGEFGIDTTGGAGAHTITFGTAPADGAKIVVMYGRT